MAYPTVTMTDPDSYRAITAWCEDALARATGKDEVFGESSGIPIKPVGVGYPLPEIMHTPRLTTYNTIGADDKTKLVNYTKAVARYFVSVFASHSVSHSVVLGNIVTNATWATMLAAIRGELANIVTAWNANKASIGSGIMSLELAPAIS